MITNAILFMIKNLMFFFCCVSCINEIFSIWYVHFTKNRGGNVNLVFFYLFICVMFSKGDLCECSTGVVAAYGVLFGMEKVTSW